MAPNISGRLEDGQGRQPSGSALRTGLVAAALSALASLPPGGALAAPPSVTVIGVDQAGNQTPVTNYRWTLEEDATKPSVPGAPANLTNLSYGFHTSYMPVVAAGKVVAGVPFVGHDPADPDPDHAYQAFPDLTGSTKRYFLSVLPDQDGPANGYQMGGAPVAPGQAAVIVYVNKYPVPAAQISVHVFRDDQPLNGAPDLPGEQGLEGFFVELVEAGGTFGMSGGQVTQDAYGNPLGTTYDPDGSVAVVGTGIVATGPGGTANIQNLFPAKYTIKIRPPVGSDWVQTSTIEGTKGIDAWVKNAEPPFFQEFGPPGHHVFVGFTHRGVLQPSVLAGTKTITGRVVNVHNSRPPDYAFYTGAPVPRCWVGLNEPNGGRALFTAPCGADSRFSIPNVPAGTWELVVWDEPLDVIIASTNVVVAPADTVVDLVEVPVFNWFARYQGRVFYDEAENGFPLDALGNQKPGMPEVPVGLRFRDGSMYQGTSTSRTDGSFEFPEVFPFFDWLAAEVDYSRFKATGATVVVDAGGPVPSHTGYLGVPSFGRLNPQAQFETDPSTGLATTSPAVNPSSGNNLSRTDTGAVLVQGLQAFLGQTVHIEFGKKGFAFGENGGISGIVQYAITRAEDDPQYAAAEPWEPGVPRVQVDLYLDCDKDGKIDRPNPAAPGTCMTQDATSLSSLGYVARLADVDNHPFCWRDPESCGLAAPERGPEDVVRSGDGVTFSYGDVFTWGADPDAGGAPYVGLAATDSWDDSLPTGCQPDLQGKLYAVRYGSDQGKTLDCFDGLRNFNQVRPAVFDGGYAFGRVAFQSDLPNADYVVEAVAPPGYRHQGSGDQNVAFGDVVSPTPLALPPRCVGPELDVPQYLNLFPGAMEPNPTWTPGARWRRCDMKAVALRSGQNPPANFFLFTEAPVAGHAVGFILDDLSSEFDPNAPTFGEKHAPPWLPVSIRDWTGREIHRVYSDQWGAYNFLVPSTFTVNPPFPSGVSPNMLTSCMNSPGPVRDPATGQMVIDPHFNRQYSQFCYTFQYLPGKTTYLDTPVVPVAAFAGPGRFPVDCELEDGTPVIYSVEGRTSTGTSYNGPFVRAEGIAPANQPRLVIVSAGTVQVPNPRYDPSVPGSTPTIPRDYGFGAARGDGVVRLGTTVLPIVSWSNDLVVARVPPGVPTGRLAVTRDSALGGRTSRIGVTVTSAPAGAPLPKVVAPGQSIQAVIDDPNTHDGDLVLVAPGTYDEYVIMDKKIQLQGWGAPSTTINAAKIDAAKLRAWRALLARKLDAQQPATCPAPDPVNGCPVTSGPNRTFDLLPGQELGFNLSDNEPILFGAEEGPGVLVVGANPAAPSPNAHVFDATNPARIDGLTVTGADFGGGILASGYADFLQVSNDRVVANYGTYGGGIRVGHTDLLDAANAAYGGYTDAHNRNVRILSNWISQNGSTEAGAGGGVTLGNGSTGYEVRGNHVCGNFSMGDGGGIGHLGLSDGGVIRDNDVLFNQTFNQSLDVTGGGIFVGGAAPLAVAGGTLSAGSGSVTIDRNLVQGNNAGAGEGGGIRLAQVNGLDVSRSPEDPAPWWRIRLTNDIVVNNVAGYAAGGVSLKDVLLSSIVNNTIADNDSTATSQQAFVANPSQSEPQPAGLVSHATSPALQAAIGSGPLVSNVKSRPFSNPVLVNNIVWHNRSFYWKIDPDVLDPVTQQPVYGLFDPVADTPAGTNPVYLDLAVLDTANQGTFAGQFIDAGADKLSPTYSVLSETIDVATSAGYGPGGILGTHNLALPDARFVRAYVNGDREQSILVPEITTIKTAATPDEGGNFIDVRYGPLTQWNCAQGQPQTYANCPAFGDYHLSGAGAATSTPVNNGLSLPGVTPADDFDGDARPLNVDIGADEYVP